MTNEIIAVEGFDINVIKIAAENFMPPQYEQFIKALQGSSEVSETTKNYWLQKYNLIAESL